MSTRHCVIVGSAPVADPPSLYAPIIADADVVIAADGGIELCLAAGRVPELLVGDLDSVSPSALALARESGVRIMTFPAEKDESDLDLALDVARAQRAARVTFTAAFAGRLDHTLAALGTLVRAADLYGEAREPQWRAYVLDPQHRPFVSLGEEPGTLLSVMACTGAASVSIAGVRYPLTRRRLDALSSLGLSNVAADPEQRVEVHDGNVIVLVNNNLS